MKCQAEVGDGTKLKAPKSEWSTSSDGKVYGNIDYNQEVTSQCLPGTFVFTGDKERTCQQDGTLTGHPLKCYSNGILCY